MQKLLGNEIYNLIISKCNPNEIYEIRIRLNSMPHIKSYKIEFFIPYTCTASTIEHIINVASGNSRYAHEQEISDGYIEYGKGFRIGIIGKGKVNDKKLIAYSSITSLCIRIPHTIQLPQNLKYLTNPFENTLIIGPPFSGKTTLIRAFSLELSQNYDVVIIDERSEITGNSHDFINKRSDIIQGIPKNIVFEKIIRSMSPQIVVCDELFSSNDINAIQNFIRAGIKCIASFHALNIDYIEPELKKIFSKFITLSSKPKVGSIVSIINKNDN